MSYDGWSNYATWRVNLQLRGVLDTNEWAENRTSNITSDKFRNGAIYDLSKYFKNSMHELVEDTAQGFALDLAVAFLNEVNWREIATRYVDAYIAENT